MKNNFVAKVGIFSAISFVLQLMGKFLPRVGGFLEVEFSDLPAIILSFAEGPVAGVMVELIKNLLHLTVSTNGGIGELANFLVSGVFVFTLGMIYKHKKTKKNAVIALLVATVVLAAAGLLINLYILLPMYMRDADFATKFKLAATLITPFNLVKGLVLSGITMIVYKKISRIIK